MLRLDKFLETIHLYSMVTNDSASTTYIAFTYSETKYLVYQNWVIKNTNKKWLILEHFYMWFCLCCIYIKFKSINNQIFSWYLTAEYNIDANTYKYM